MDLNISCCTVLNLGDFVTAIVYHDKSTLSFDRYKFGSNYAKDVVSHH